MTISRTVGLWHYEGTNRQDSDCSGGLWQLMAQVHTESHLEMQRIDQCD